LLRTVAFVPITPWKDAHRSWFLLDSHDEVLAILRCGDVTTEELEEHESTLRRWGCSSVVLMLTDAKVAALIERGWKLMFDSLEDKQAGH
jgi:hypothetical protein